MCKTVLLKGLHIGCFLNMLHLTCKAAVTERESLDFWDILTLHSRSNKANAAAPEEISVLHKKKTKAMNLGKSENDVRSRNLFLYVANQTACCYT